MGLGHVYHPDALNNTGLSQSYSAWKCTQLREQCRRPPGEEPPMAGPALGSTRGHIFFLSSSNTVT